jgi:hypothetical protein
MILSFLRFCLSSVCMYAVIYMTEWSQSELLLRPAEECIP